MGRRTQDEDALTWREAKRDPVALAMQRSGQRAARFQAKRGKGSYKRKGRHPDREA